MVNTFRLVLSQSVFNKSLLAPIFLIDAIELQTHDAQQLFSHLAIFQRNGLITRALFFLFFAILTDLVKAHTSIPLPLSRPGRIFTNLANQIFSHNIVEIFKRCKRCHFHDLFRISDWRYGTTEKTEKNLVKKSKIYVPFITIFLCKNLKKI